MESITEGELVQVSKFCFSQKYKLKSSDDFRKVFAFRSKVSNAHLALYAMPNNFSFNRLGVAVGKINGNAVVRNKIKRFLREAFRLTREQQYHQGFDFVVVPKKGCLLEIHVLQESFLKLTSQAITFQKR